MTARKDGWAPPPEAQRVEQVAAALLEARGEDAARRGEPIWLELSGPAPDRREIEVDRAEGLLGWVAAPGAWAVAVVATGRLRPLDPAIELPASLLPARAGRLQMTCVVDRLGRVGWRTDLSHPGPLDRPPEEGRMLDVLRRSLGLTTPPPPRPWLYVEVVDWLGRIAGLGLRSTPLRWPQVAALRPDLVAHLPAAIGTSRAHPRTTGGGPGTPDRVDCHPFTPLPTWEDIRRISASGAPQPGLPDPHLVAWMDEGMFARWVLAELPSPDELLASVRRLVSPDAARRLAHVVGCVSNRWGPIGS